ESNHSRNSGNKAGLYFSFGGGVKRGVSSRLRCEGLLGERERPLSPNGRINKSVFEKNLALTQRTRKEEKLLPSRKTVSKENQFFAEVQTIP
ncbi:MAG: hypothetical protein AAGI66_02685, partial [Cyanobacteria bacterium P01_H01_bin.74]